GWRLGRSRRGSASVVGEAIGPNEVMSRPRLLVVSHVLPFPGSSGQSQRVAYTLRSARQKFEVTFLAVAKRAEAERIRSGVAEFCDNVVLLPSVSSEGVLGRFAQLGAAELYAARTGLKRSNYVIGELEFAPERLTPVLRRGDYDCALFEYWHAWRAA